MEQYWEIDGYIYISSGNDSYIATEAMAIEIVVMSGYVNT